MIRAVPGEPDAQWYVDCRRDEPLSVSTHGPIVQLSGAVERDVCAVGYLDEDTGDLVVERIELTGKGSLARSLITRAPMMPNSAGIVFISENGQLVTLAMISGDRLESLAVYRESGALQWSLEHDWDGSFNRISMMPDHSAAIVQLGDATADSQTLYRVAEGGVEVLSSVDGLEISELWPSAEGILLVTSDDSAGRGISLVPLSAPNIGPKWTVATDSPVSQLLTTEGVALILSWQSVQLGSGAPAVTSEATLIDRAGHVVWRYSEPDGRVMGALAPDGSRAMLQVSQTSGQRGILRATAGGAEQAINDCLAFGFTNTGDCVVLTTDGLRVIE